MGTCKPYVYFLASNPRKHEVRCHIIPPLMGAHVSRSTFNQRIIVEDEIDKLEWIINRNIENQSL
jgi:hypothetical protein